MAEEQVERRLAAILAADVVGYSRLMEANEERTLGALRQHRREFFDPTVAKHGGRIFKVMGDGFLVEFGSVLNAARCAVEIQTGMHDRNAGVPDDRQIKFRIGINVGDIIVDGDDFYGDGVNLASRLEALAGPGGIACSAVVRQQIGNKLEIEFIDQGEKRAENQANRHLLGMQIQFCRTVKASLGCPKNALNVALPPFWPSMWLATAASWSATRQAPWLRSNPGVERFFSQ